MTRMVNLTPCRKWLLSLLDGLESLEIRGISAIIEQGYALEELCKQESTFEEEEEIENWCSLVSHSLQMALTQNVDQDLLSDLNVVLARLWEALGEFQLAVPLFVKEADRDNLAAIYCLAHAHEMGAGVDKNQSKAQELYQKAADHGSGNAQFRMAKAYESGEWGDIDLEKALQYCIQAIENRCLPAQKWFFTDNNEEFVEKCNHPALAFYYWKALHGDAKAQLKLAQCYQEGIGVPQNSTLSYEWLLRANEPRNAKV